MGMYTGLNIGVVLTKDTPDEVINILEYMLSERNGQPCLIDHPLFKTDRWDSMLVTDSYYINGRTDSSLVRDDITQNYELNVRCNLKNYCKEIQLFLNFIHPFVMYEGFIGYMIYESDEKPTLIYNDIFDGIILENMETNTTSQIGYEWLYENYGKVTWEKVE